MRDFIGYKNGVNFGGWLSQCDHTKERYDSFIREEDFKKVSMRNFDHVRIPIDYELFENEDGSFNLDRLKYIDFAIEMCRKYGLNMVLDLHRTPGYSFDDGHGESGFFDSEKYQNHFYEIWDLLAERYAKDTDLVAFELLNEVTKKEYCDIWNRVSTECIKRIRKFAPDAYILLGGYYNNSVEALKDLAMPYDDHIVYNFHCYEPLLFTHQGAFWIPTMDTKFRCNYRMTYKEYNEGGVKYLGWTDDKCMNYPDDEVISEKFFEDLIKEAVRVAEERNVPLYCGEYGVIELANRNDAREWFRDFHHIMDKYSVGRAVWTYKEMDFEIDETFGK